MIQQTNRHSVITPILLLTVVAITLSIPVHTRAQDGSGGDGTGNGDGSGTSSGDGANGQGSGGGTNGQGHCYSSCGSVGTGQGSGTGTGTGTGGPPPGECETMNGTIVTCPPNPCPNSVPVAQSNGNGYQAPPNLSDAELQAKYGDDSENQDDGGQGEGEQGSDPGAFNFCVSNGSGNTYFIPARTQIELQDFYNAASGGQLSGVSTSQP